MLPLLLTLACTPSTPPPVPPPPPREVTPSPIPTEPAVKAPTFRLEGMAAPTDPAQWGEVHTTQAYVVGDERKPLTWSTLAVAGQTYGDHTLGLLLDATGKPIQEGGEPLPCDDIDFAGLMQAHGSLFLAQHVECIPGALYLSKLAASPEGALSVTSTRPVDVTAIGGTYNPCAGDITPWGTWLSSQEYEQDVLAIQPDGTVKDDRWGYNRMKDYLGVPANQVNPYAYGWIPEITVTDAEGATSVRQHYTMGRFSHELGRVMPDQRTVLMSDDGVGSGMFLFVADLPGKLTSGRLYAARWTGQPDGGATLDWVHLGFATDDEIAPTVRNITMPFNAIFRSAPPKDGVCPPDLRPAWSNNRLECLTVEPGRDKIASRLETRRFAALRGATMEFNKGEGIAIDPAGKVAYYAFSAIDDAMLAGKPSADVDHIALDPNACGAIYALRLAGGARDHQGRDIASDWVPQAADLAIAGVPQGDGRCDVEGIANPDNLAFIPEAGTLLIAEDTRQHDLATLWGWSVADRKLVRLLTTPYRGEVTGIGWYPGVNGAGYITVTVQHPFEASKLPKPLPPGVVVPATPQPSFTGVFGPIHTGG